MHRLPFSNSIDLHSGFSLAGSKPGKISSAILIVIVWAATIAIVVLGDRKDRRSAVSAGTPGQPNIELGGYNATHGQSSDNDKTT